MNQQLVPPSGGKGIRCEIAQNTSGNHTLISKQQLRTKLGGVSETTIYRMVLRGEIPKPILISKGRSMWIENEIDARIDKLAGERAA